MYYESNFSDENSCYDVVEIEDLVSGDKLARCGSTIPSDITTKSNQVRISFTSDFSDAGNRKPTGFRLTYSTISSKDRTIYLLNFLTVQMNTI